MIDRATVDKIIDAARIVDVVGEFVTLKKAGVNYKGLCPFHDDRNPSFMVSPAKNICHCFVCGKGGTPVSFLMEHEQITYPEALRWLAKKYNIEIVEKELTDEERAQQSERESMFVINEWARDWFHNTLKNDPDGIAIGKQYFRSRGIRDDIIEKFQLGYSPQRRDALATAALQQGYKKEFLVKTGLCIENEKGIYDRYSGRAIFPWLNVSGKVVAFGGRVLDSRTKGVAQKYVNSPDSDIYHKERELYGIYQAKKAIVKEDRVFMVEGYTDVIAMHQAGVENVVANSGTALSVHQIRLLHRFTSNITLLYDGDEAGIHAAMRGTDMLLEEGMNIKVLLLPDGDDPDSFSRKHNAQEFKQYIEEHQKDFIQFKSDLMLRGVSDPIKRSEAINSIVRSISVIPDQIVRATYITDCSHRLGINEATLISSMNKMIREGKSAPRNLPKGDEHHYAQEQNTPAQHATPLATQRGSEGEAAIESMLIRTIIRHGGETLYDNVETDDGATISLTVAQYINFNLSTDGLSFSNPIYNKVLEEAARYTTDDNFDSATYFTRHPDVEISSLATDMLVDPVQLSKSLQMRKEENSLQNHVEHLILDFRLNYVDSHMKDVQRQIILNANDPERMMQMMQQYKDLQEVRNQLAKKLGSNILV